MSTRTLSLSDALYGYLLALSPHEHQALIECRRLTSSMSTAKMQISPEQGHFIAFLVKLLGVKKALEVGVFTGYSSTTIALAMPEDSRLIACDVNPEWTKIAKKIWDQAGVSSKITLKIGPAIETLESLIEQGERGSFDFAFIDADKRSYDQYYERCLELIREGGLIIIDNVFFGGEVINPIHENSISINELNKKIKADNRVDYCFVPLGDGLLMLRKLSHHR